MMLLIPEIVLFSKCTFSILENPKKFLNFGRSGSTGMNKPIKKESRRTKNKEQRIKNQESRAFRGLISHSAHGGYHNAFIMQTGISYCQLLSIVQYINAFISGMKVFVCTLVLHHGCNNFKFQRSWLFKLELGCNWMAFTGTHITLMKSVLECRLSNSNWGKGNKKKKLEEKEAQFLHLSIAL